MMKDRFSQSYFNCLEIFTTIVFDQQLEYFQYSSCSSGIVINKTATGAAGMRDNFFFSILSNYRRWKHGDQFAFFKKQKTRIFEFIFRMIRKKISFLVNTTVPRFVPDKLIPLGMMLAGIF